MTAIAAFPALGSTAVVVVAREQDLPTARELLERELAEIDASCSRFRADSELAAVNDRAGQPVQVSPLFATALQAALDAARTTDGLVDPALGADLRAVGYDRTFALVRTRERWTIAPRERRIAAWREIALDAEALTVQIPAGVELDLGATAKALAADRAASAITAATGDGALVSLGGDIAVAGRPPAAGWLVRIADDHGAPLDGPGPVVGLQSGGLATSSTSVRRWQTDRGEAHHVLDPSSGLPALTPWRIATVAAATCLDANVASTAALLLGARAPEWLRERGLPARLVAVDEAVVTVAGWPAEAEAA